MLSMGFDDSELALVNPAEAERLNKQYEETKAWAQQLVDSAHKAYSELENAAYDQIKIGAKFLKQFVDIVTEIKG